MTFRTPRDHLFLFFRETIIISVVTIFQHLFSSTCVRLPTNNVQSVHFKVPLYNNISLRTTRKQFRYIIYNLIYLRACIAVLTFTGCTFPFLWIIHNTYTYSGYSLVCRYTYNFNIIKLRYLFTFTTQLLYDVIDEFRRVRPPLLFQKIV